MNRADATSKITATLDISPVGINVRAWLSGGACALVSAFLLCCCVAVGFG